MTIIRKSAPADATADALSLIAAKLETMDRRHSMDNAELRAGQDDIRAMLLKLMDGQAVLLQNDMEIRRRLDRLSD